MNQDDVVRMALKAGFETKVLNSIDGEEVVCFDPLITDMLKDFATIVAANERSRISEKFWDAIKDCITTDELGIEFMSKFYQVHEFGHWLDGEK